MAPSKSKSGKGKGEPEPVAPVTTIPDNILPAPALPLWSEADVDAESWGALATGGGDKKASKKGKGAGDGQVGELFEDPDGPLALPPSLQEKLSSFVRPAEFFAPQIEAILAAKNAALAAEAEAQAAAAATTSTKGKKTESKKSKGASEEDTEVPKPVILKQRSVNAQTFYHDGPDYDQATAERKRQRAVDRLSNTSGVSTLTWMQSVFALCAENEALFPNGSYLWENIYPQEPETRAPIYNPSGKYAVRVWQDGAWRKLIIDDTIPVDADGNALLVTNANESDLVLWPILLSKAILKLSQGNPSVDEGHAHEFVHWLTGANAHVVQPASIESFLSQLAHNESQGNTSPQLLALARPEGARDEGNSPQPDPSLAFEPATVYCSTSECSREDSGGALVRLSCVEGEWKGQYSDHDRTFWDADLELELGVELQDRLDGEASDYFMSAMDAHTIYTAVYVYTLQHTLKFHDSITSQWTDITKEYTTPPAPWLCVTVDDATELELALDAPAPREKGADPGTTCLSLYSVDPRTGITAPYPSVTLSATRHGCVYFSVPAGRSVWSLAIDAVRGYSVTVSAADLTAVFGDAMPTEELPAGADTAAGGKDAKKKGGKDDKTATKKETVKGGKDKKGDKGASADTVPDPLTAEDAVHLVPLSAIAGDARDERTSALAERRAALCALEVDPVDEVGAAKLVRLMGHVSYQQQKMTGVSDVTLTTNTAQLAPALDILANRLDTHVREVPLVLSAVKAPSIPVSPNDTAIHPKWHIWFKFTFNVTASTDFRAALRVPPGWAKDHAHRVRFTLIDNATLAEKPVGILTVLPTTLEASPAGYTLLCDVRAAAGEDIAETKCALQIASSRALDDLTHLPQLPGVVDRALYEPNRHSEFFRVVVNAGTASLPSFRLDVARGTEADEERMKEKANEGAVAVDTKKGGKANLKTKSTKGKDADKDNLARDSDAALAQSPLLAPGDAWIDVPIRLALYDKDEVIAHGSGLNTAQIPLVAVAAGKVGDEKEEKGGKSKKGGAGDKLVSRKGGATSTADLDAAAKAPEEEHAYILVASIDNDEWIRSGLVEESPEADVLKTFVYTLTCINNAATAFAPDTSEANEEAALKEAWGGGDRPAHARSVRNEFLIAHGLEPEPQVAAAVDAKGKKGDKAKGTASGKGKDTKTDSKKKGGKKGEPEPEPEPEIEIIPVRPEHAELPEGETPQVVTDLDSYVEDQRKAAEGAVEQFKAEHEERVARRQKQQEGQDGGDAETSTAPASTTANWCDERDEQFNRVWSLREAYRQRKEEEAAARDAAAKAEADAAAAALKAEKGAKKGKK